MKKETRQYNRIKVFINDFTSKNTYTPEILKEYNDKFKESFSVFLNNGKFAKSVLKNFEYFLN